MKKTLTKLSIHIGILSISMILISFFTDTQFWNDVFCFKAHDFCRYGPHHSDSLNEYRYGEHYHWNFRGWVYFITGFAYFIISVIKIILDTSETYEKEQKNNQLNK